MEAQTIKEVAQSHAPTKSKAGPGIEILKILAGYWSPGWAVVMAWPDEASAERRVKPISSGPFPSSFHPPSQSRASVTFPDPYTRSCKDT